MSDMLGKAIIDATALKESAIKNAEVLLLEKYSSQIKEAVNSLLEQDDEETDLTDAPLDSLDANASTEFDTGTTTQNDSQITKDVPLAATEGKKLCPCPDEEEEIEIDFGDLENQLGQPDEKGMDSGLGGEDIKIDVGGEKEPEQIPEKLQERFGVMADIERVKLTPEEYQVISHFYEGQDDPLFKIINTASIEADRIPEAIKNISKHLHSLPRDDKETANGVVKKLLAIQKGQDIDDMNERYELNEDNLDSLLEELDVDLEPVPNGWLSTNQSERERNEEMRLAKLQDTKVKEELEALKKTVKSLEETTNKLKETNDKLNKEKEEVIKESKEYKGIALQIKDKLYEMNIMNAKLLYTNRVLKDGSLNERQKNNLVESIQKTNSVEEAKIVYETLQNSVGSVGKKGPQSLNEAVNKSSSSTFLISKKSDVKPDLVSQRMQVLAGIKRKN